MSNVDDDVADCGLDALRTARVEGLRRCLVAFLDEHDREVDLHAIREETAGGTPLSDLVDADRDEQV